MEDILYFDINSGISGDMTIASLLDLGVDQNKFLNELKKLNLAGYEIKISTLQKNRIKAIDFKVVLEDARHPFQVENDRHHFYNEYSNDHYNKSNSCGDHYNIEHAPHSDLDNRCGERHTSHVEEHHETQNGHYVNRGFNDIKELINQSELSQNVKDLSINIFTKVAEAEAKVHNKVVDEVHFHEIGAVDSIVDIVGTAILINLLNPDHIYASPVSLGTGFVDVAYGRMPVPAPATIEILKDVPVYSTEINAELVTPTGAAIIKTLADKFIIMPELKIFKVAYGAGKRNIPTTQMLRIYQAKKI